MSNYNEIWKKKISESIKKSEFFKNLKLETEKNKQFYYSNPKLCPICKKIIEYEKRINKFCSHRCSGYCNSPGKKHSQTTKNKISNSIKNSEIYKINNKIGNDLKYQRRNQNIIIKSQCPICKKEFFYTKTVKNKIFCSRECFIFDQKNGHKYSKKVPGGYRKGSSRGKSGYYKGIWCDSTYELVWVIYNLDHQIKFQRNTKGFEYEYNNQKHKYYPDFILENNLYIEIKNFLQDKDKEKFKQFPYQLKVLFGNDLKECFEYVKQKYNTSYFEKLYDKSKMLPAEVESTFLG